MNRDTFLRLQKIGPCLTEGKETLDEGITIPPKRSRIDAARARMSDASLSPEDRDAAKRSYELHVMARRKAMKEKMKRGRAVKAGIKKAFPRTEGNETLDEAAMKSPDDMGHTELRVAITKLVGRMKRTMGVVQMAKTPAQRAKAMATLAKWKDHIAQYNAVLKKRGKKTGGQGAEEPYAGDTEASGHKIKGQHVRFYDNGGKTDDRYTAVLGKANKSEHEMISMSDKPDHPQGISQYGVGNEGKHLGRLLYKSEVPKHIKDHVKSRLSEY